MHDYGFLSLMPSLLAIVLALLTKRVLPSLFVGIVSGYLVVAQGSFFAGIGHTVQGLWNTLMVPSNWHVILFTGLVGALLGLIQHSGGMQAFIEHITAFLKSRAAYSKRAIQLLAMLSGAVLFVETNISILTVGTLFRPIFDHVKLARTRLAYICDSTSAPMCILFPFNAWGGAILGILIAQGFENPISVLFQGTLFNFYAQFALLILFLSLFTGREIGTHPTAVRIPAVPMPTSSDTPSAQSSLRNMILPIVVLLVGMPISMILTGQSAAQGTGWNWVKVAFVSGQGALSVLLAVSAALFTALFYYATQGRMSQSQAWRSLWVGAKNMWPMMLMMLFAFGLGDVCQALNTGEYLAGYAQSWLVQGMLPLVFFLLAALTSFSTGTSWGTFAIMLPLVLPICTTTGDSIPLCVGAVLGGSVFGDHSSPISDTTLISSLAAGCQTIDHVRTQLPYALIAATLAIVMYLVLGFNL